MKHTFSSKKIFFAVLCIFCSSAVFSQQPIPEKPRILISTDIGGTDPDDNQSIAHFLIATCSIQRVSYLLPLTVPAAKPNC